MIKISKEVTFSSFSVFVSLFVLWQNNKKNPSMFSTPILEFLELHRCYLSKIKNSIIFITQQTLSLKIQNVL